MKPEHGPKTPVFHTEREVQGSITIEASFVLPLFIFAMLLIMDLFTMLGFYMSVDRAIDIEAKKLAKEAFEDEVADRDVICSEIIAILRQNSSFPIENGEEGLDLSGSMLDDREIIRLEVSYRFKPSFNIFGLVSPQVTQRRLMHTWIGYERGLFATGTDEGDEEVYVAQNGSVYHSTLLCSHINLSISQTTGDIVEGLRNTDGGRYRPCEQCHAHTGDGILYITDNGDRYHNSLTCSGLRRTVSAMSLSEALSRGLRPCMRCAGNTH